MRSPSPVVFCAVLAALGLTPPAWAQRPRVAVIVVGDDEPAVGNLQLELEEHLASFDNITLVPSREIAAKIARKVRRPDPAKWRPDAEAERIFREAKDHYFQDELVQAIRKLEKLDNLYQEARIPTPVRAQTDLLLWRTAVHLALQEDDAALRYARTALTLDPELQVDRTVFPPSVDTLIEDTREALETAVVQVQTNPPGSGIEIDERLVDIEFRVPAGSHELVVYADYFEPIRRKFTLSRFIVLKVGLPIAVEPPIEKFLVHVIEDSSDSINPLQKMQLSRLQQILGVDAVVLFAARGEAGSRRALVFWEDGEARLSPRIEKAHSQGVLFNWMGSVLDELSRPDRSGHASPWVGWRFNAMVGPLHGTRFRRLRNPEDTSSFNAGFNGNGFGLYGDLDRRGILGEAEIEYVPYRTDTQVILGTNSATVSGGATWASRVGAGYRYRFGELGMTSRHWVDATAGLRTWSHAAEDVGTSGMGPLGVLTSYRWTAIDLRVRGGYVLPIDFFGEPMVHAGFTIVPFSVFKEDGELTGTDPEPQVAFGWELGASLMPARRLRVRLDYHGERLDVRFKGPATVPINPAIVDARWAETRHTWMLRVQREF